MGCRPTRRPGPGVRGVLVALAVLAGVLSAPTASPAAPDRPSFGRPAMATVATSADADAVLAYWTPRRMAAALPISLDPDGRLVRSAPAAARHTTARATLTSPRSAGKLFFTTPQGDAMCSAAAVNTGQKNVVVTAAHCAHTGPGGLLSPARYYTNFLFVPRYANGSAPDGRWVGSRAVTHSQWIQREDLAYDQALIQVLPRNGHDLVDVVGGNGLAWNFPARESDIRVWGWPAEAPYDGETVRRCTGPTSSFDGTADAKIACGMTGGASGGPWFIGMLDSDVGFIWAVTSRRTTTGDKYLIAHPMTSAMRTLLAATGTSSAVGRPVAGEGDPSGSRVVARAGGIHFRAVRSHVGRGQLLRLRARTAPYTRIVLFVKLSRRSSWRSVDVKHTNGSGVVEFRQRPAKAGLRWYRVRTSRAASDALRVRVHWCPLPDNRAAAVVDATDCTNPAR